MATFIIGLALIALVVLIIRSIIKEKKKGGCIGCSGSCGHCSGHCAPQKREWDGTKMRQQYDLRFIHEAFNKISCADEMSAFNKS